MYAIVNALVCCLVLLSLGGIFVHGAGRDQPFHSHQQAAQAAEVASAAWAGHEDFPTRVDSSLLALAGHIMQ